ncbi:MAG: glycosyltransferase family 4 protein [Bacteroidetes bacterium]|nr:glycosyltransferase family 4 protein [Bacteroidota bacterium]
MKIALIHYRLLRRGGLENRLINYMEYLSGAGHDVTIICSKRSDEVAVPPSVEVVKLGLGMVPKHFRQWYFNYRLGKFMSGRKFDFSLSMGRTSHQDAVIEPGNHLGYMRAMNKTSKGLMDRLKINMDKNGFNNSKIIFAASGMVKQELIDLFNIPEEKIKIVYPPINTDRFNREKLSAKKELRKKFGMQEDTTYFAFISTGNKRKGLDLLLHAFEDLKSEKIELIVAGKEKIHTRLKNIRYTGYIQNPMELYAAADFTIYPSYYDAYGQVVTESLHCMTPVLISHKVGASELISEKEGQVINSFDRGEWTEAIRAITNKEFSIDPDFVINNQLSVTQHMEKILNHWQAFKNSTN